MVDNNDIRDLYSRSEGTRDRNKDIPLSGIRYSTNEMVFSNPCEHYGLEPDDRVVRAYT